MPLQENVGWESVLYLLASGGKQAACCRLSQFAYTFSSGDRLRIVKEVEGQTVAAEFRLEEGAAVSAETPYGFGALEELPERERMVLALRYYRGMTQSRCARIMGVSQVQISRLERRGLESLRRRLTGE